MQRIPALLLLAALLSAGAVEAAPHTAPQLAADTTKTTSPVVIAPSISYERPKGTLKVRGEGVPAASGRTGDLYLKVIIKIPTRISSNGRKLLSEFSAMEGENTAPEMIPLSKL